MSHEDPFASRPRHPALPAAGWVVLAIAAPLALLLSMIGVLSLAAVSATVSARADEIRAGADPGAGFSGTEGWPEPEAESEPEPDVEPEVEPSRQYPPGTIGLDDAVEFGAAPVWSETEPGWWDPIDGVAPDTLAFSGWQPVCEVYLRSGPESVVGDPAGGDRAASEAMAATAIGERLAAEQGEEIGTRAQSSRALALGSWTSEAKLEFWRTDTRYRVGDTEHTLAVFARVDADGTGGYATATYDCLVAPNAGPPMTGMLTLDFVLDYD
ncbi:hypothetical protein [Agromyces soli]|uniref:Uncharacterized protein n=1 Tax=Agromyces soli TaxID=659012 RepID=A0ABY4ATT4_9MICO|nr:hypothetical protein [Agromyces soli]UOE26528.1 hypothetical protein MTP13_01740 [Agromyces soli]